MTDLIEQLGQDFAPYVEKIRATQKTSIKLHLIPALDLPLLQSKVGGKPYLPLTQDYPTNEAGQRLQMIVQINFAELPANEIYPKQGILQFYIDANDDLLGLDFDNMQNQTGFRVLFHENLIQDEQQLQHFDDESIAEITKDGSPVNGEYAIQFSIEQQYISLNDQSFAPQILGVEDLYEYDDFTDDHYDTYDEVISATGHRLGGYPFFTQSDPRYQEQFQSYILLLQIDTDDVGEVDIMWGDAGVGNFFIHPDDLKNKDFTKVFYNWDCH